MNTHYVIVQCFFQGVALLNVFRILGNMHGVGDRNCVPKHVPKHGPVNRSDRKWASKSSRLSQSWTTLMLLSFSISWKTLWLKQPFSFRVDFISAASVCKSPKSFSGKVFILNMTIIIKTKRYSLDNSDRTALRFAHQLF